jgi:hypothetical protein
MCKSQARTSPVGGEWAGATMTIASFWRSLYDCLDERVWTRQTKNVAMKIPKAAAPMTSFREKSKNRAMPRP